jgi:50S ribosome-binding GTPase
MTAAAAPVRAGPIGATPDPLDRCLATLLQAADAADELGVVTEAVRAAHADGIRRIGFPGDAYVLAFVGGTGVGKSSLLNALAGEAVSPASVRRPTTSEPVAWVPADEREALGPLLEWLGVDEVREHAADHLGPVAILDLPDMDSVESSHRVRVEAILPRVDAVAWVTDPEKYHDAALHDDFLLAWLPRLARQVVIVNKSDRLGADDGRRIRRDLEADVASIRSSGAGLQVPVLMTSAASTPDVDGLRRWLSDGIAAKAIVRARVAATAVDHVHRLAREAGIDPRNAATPYLDAKARSVAIDEATAAVLRSIDLGGLERQAEAATRARARARGTGPMGRITSLIYRLSGRETRAADPDGYLVRWRDRGPLTPAVEAIRVALSAPLRAASPAVRPLLAAAVEPTELRRGLERAVDRAIGGLGPLEPPTSRWWSVIGFLQTLATAGIALSVAWIVIGILGGPAAGSVQVPILGSVPTPFATLVAFLAIGYLLARLLGLHAGWVGRRWARRVRDRVAAAVRDEVSQRGLSPFDALEEARGRLWTAASSIDRTCGRR